jgi:NAD(P)-dependent dehydrogenase (short-subunit alcohol dehydrogenase family)
MDVAKAEDVDALARQTLDAFGAVHLLINNAGVGAGGPAWESTLLDWEWVLGVNLWGVIHGVRVFVPIMLEQGTEGHVVNVSSIAGFMSDHPSAPYQVSKHAVVALTEQLYAYLTYGASKIKVSVLCPGWVNTRIMDSERNRPPELQNPDELPPTPEQEAMLEQMRKAAAQGLPPKQVADAVFDAIHAERFYIFTHPEFTPMIQMRASAALEGRDPPTPMLQ